MAAEMEIDHSRLVQYRNELAEAEADVARLAKELSALMLTLETASQRGRKHLQRGGAASELSLITDEIVLRPQLDERLEEFREARKRAKVLCIQLAAEEGVALSEIGRRFGVSRQYVSKLLKRQPLGAPPTVSADETVPK